MCGGFLFWKEPWTIIGCLFSSSPETWLIGVVNEEPQPITTFHSDIDYFNESKHSTQGDKIKVLVLLWEQSVVINLTYILLHKSKKQIQLWKNRQFLFPSLSRIFISHMNCTACRHAFEAKSSHNIKLHVKSKHFFLNSQFLKHT